MDSAMTTNDPFMDEATPEPAFAAAPDFDPRRHRDDALDARDGSLRDRPVAEFRPEWRPMADLPVPAKQDGFSYRYVRVSDHGYSDTRNVARKFAEGWEPVTSAEQPGIVKMLGRMGVNAEGNIEVGGLLLCKLPNEVRQQRERYYRKVASDQLSAVDNNYMRDADRRMPKLAPERRSSISGSPLG